MDKHAVIKLIHGFSSLSESGFIPTRYWIVFNFEILWVCSHLFQRVASFLLTRLGIYFSDDTKRFSSLSESGFIPTSMDKSDIIRQISVVLISFREWLHSYLILILKFCGFLQRCSHLFQRVASFLHIIKQINISLVRHGFSSLSESGFIPTDTKEFLWCLDEPRSHLFQRVASFLLTEAGLEVKARRF